MSILRKMIQAIIDHVDRQEPEDGQVDVVTLKIDDLREWMELDLLDTGDRNGD